MCPRVRNGPPHTHERTSLRAHMRTAARLAVNIDEVGEDKERRGGLSSERLEREEGEAKRVEALLDVARERRDGKPVDEGGRRCPVTTG